MTEPSIKSRIVARLLQLPEPLKADGKLRLIARKRTFFLLEPVKPALHLITEDEQVTVEDERGYTMIFPVSFKLILAAAHDAEARCDELAAWLQEKIEADEQLNGLASKITYDGELPFTEEQGKPDGGTVVMYTVEYRRYRGDPGRSY